jgi:hypothetical protein
VGLHDLRDHLVLVGQLGLEGFDPLLQATHLAAVVALEGGRPMLEELLLPSVEDVGVEAELVTEVGDRRLLEQMPPQDGHLLLSREPPTLLRHGHFLLRLYMLTARGEMSNSDWSMSTPLRGRVEGRGSRVEWKRLPLAD